MIRPEGIIIVERGDPLAARAADGFIEGRHSSHQPAPPRVLGVGTAPLEIVKAHTRIVEIDDGLSRGPRRGVADDDDLEVLVSLCQHRWDRSARKEGVVAKGRNHD